VKLRVTDDIENLNVSPLTEVLEMMDLPTTLPSDSTTGNFSLMKTLALIQYHLKIRDAIFTVGIEAHPQNKSRRILLVRHCSYTLRIFRLLHNT
jgi:hypothetical protein